MKCPDAIKQRSNSDFGASLMHYGQLFIAENMGMNRIEEEDQEGRFSFKKTLNFNDKEETQ